MIHKFSNIFIIRFTNSRWIIFKRHWTTGQNIRIIFHLWSLLYDFIAFLPDFLRGSFTIITSTIEDCCIYWWGQTLSLFNLNTGIYCLMTLPMFSIFLVLLKNIFSLFSRQSKVRDVQDNKKKTRTINCMVVYNLIFIIWYYFDLSTFIRGHCWDFWDPFFS
jgi:hypothetical protein